MPNIAQQRIDQVTISPQQIAETYDNGEEGFQKHKSLYQAIEVDGLLPAQYAKSLGFRRSDGNPYNYAYADAVRWREGRYPFAIKGLVRLNALGVFEGQSGFSFDENNPSDSHFNIDELKDFTPENKHFELLALLQSTMFWSGYLDNTTNSRNNTSKVAIMNMRHMDQHTYSIMKILVDKIEGLDWNQPNFNSSHSPNGIEVGFRSCIARILTILGGYLGRKSTQDLNIPQIVESAMFSLKNYNTKNLNYTDLAYRVLRDFIGMFFVIRGNFSQHGSRFKACLTSHRESSVADEQLGIFKKITDLVGLNGLRITTTPIKQMAEPKYGNVMSHTHRVHANARDVERIKHEMHGRVQMLTDSV